MESRKEYYPENILTISGIIKNILFKDEFLVIRLLLILAAISGFLNIFYHSVVFSCQLHIFQNLILPFIISTEILWRIGNTPLITRIKVGTLSGILSGGIPAFITISISNIEYDFFGYREIAFSAQKLPLPPLTASDFIVGIESQILLFFLLILISGIIGFISSFIRIRRQIEY